MPTLLHLAIKDLRLISRDWLGLFFILGLPVLLGLFFGIVGASSASSSSSESQRLPVAIVDEDDSPQSQRLQTLLRDNDSFRFEATEKQPALQAVRRGQRAAVVVIPAGFGEAAGAIWSEQTATLQVASDPSQAAVSGMLEGFLLQAMGQLTMERMQDIDAMRPVIEQSRNALQQDQEISLPQRVLLTQLFDSLDGFMESLDEVQNASDANGADEANGAGLDFQLAEIESLPLQPVADEQPPELAKIRTAWDISFPSAILWGVLGCSAGFAVSIVREQTQGTLTRLQIAPLTRTQLLLGKALACFLAVILVVTLLTTLAMVLGMRPHNIAMLVAAGLAVAICFVGVMMTLSVVGRTEEAVSGASWGFNIVAAMLGGGMIPLIFMPGFLRPLSHISPVKWGVLALEGAIWRQFTWLEFAVPASILVGIGCVGFTVGSVLLSRR